VKNNYQTFFILKKLITQSFLADSC